MKRLLLSLLALVALVGCGLTDRVIESATEKAFEKATGISVEESKDGNTVTIKGQDGQEITLSDTEGKLVDDFPLPLYPGATVGTSGTVTNGDEVTYTAEILFKDDIAKVADFYQQALEDRGIAEVGRIESTGEGEDSVILSGESETETAGSRSCMTRRPGRGPSRWSTGISSAPTHARGPGGKVSLSMIKTPVQSDGRGCLMLFD